jgi:hypothetical protein
MLLALAAAFLASEEIFSAPALASRVLLRACSAWD